METGIIILIGVAVAALGLLILRLGRKIALFLLATGGLAAVIAIAWALAEQARATRQAAQATTVAAATSAATTIIVFLLVVILTMVLAAVGVVLGWHWLQGYQERQKMRKALQQAQIYALLSGTRPPASRIPRPAMPAQAGGNILVFPGQQRPQPTIEDFRAMLEAMSEQPDPLAGLLPPDDGEMWQ